MTDAPAGHLAREIAEAEARVFVLKQQAAHADCHALGHDWESLGGANCGCYDASACSVPVNTCKRCGECDYGENADAKDIREHCEDRS